jgi:acyl carrier protein
VVPATYRPAAAPSEDVREEKHVDRGTAAELVAAEVATVLGEDPSELTDGTDLRERYDIDSLEVMEIGTRLEGVFAVRLDLAELAGLRTVGDIVDLMTRQSVPA